VKLSIGACAYRSFARVCFVIAEYMESRHGGVIFIVVPQTQAEEGCELGPTSSRRAMVPTCLPVLRADSNI